MSVHIPAKSLKPDDVIIWEGFERIVNTTEKYRKGGRKWVNVCLVNHGGNDFKDVAIPADAMVQWRGSALF